jgi:hypothetical protein
VVAPEPASTNHRTCRQALRGRPGLVLAGDGTSSPSRALVENQHQPIIASRTSRTQRLGRVRLDAVTVVAPEPASTNHRVSDESDHLAAQLKASHSDPPAAIRATAKRSVIPSAYGKVPTRGAGDSDSSLRVPGAQPAVLPTRVGVGTRQTGASVHPPCRRHSSLRVNTSPRGFRALRDPDSPAASASAPA